MATSALSSFRVGSLVCRSSHLVIVGRVLPRFERPPRFLLPPPQECSLVDVPPGAPFWRGTWLDLAEEEMNIFVPLSWIRKSLPSGFRTSFPLGPNVPSSYLTVEIIIRFNRWLISISQRRFRERISTLYQSTTTCLAENILEQKASYFQWNHHSHLSGV